MKTAALAIAAIILSALQLTPSHAAPNSAVAQFVTLGTAGGPVIRVNRSEPANAVVVGSSVYLFDVGDGVQRQLAAAGLPLAQVKAVFISHHHMDHNAGLGPLMMTHWLFHPAPPLPVYGPPGTTLMIHGLEAANRPTALAPVTIGGPPTPPISATVSPDDLPPVLDVPTEMYRDPNVRVLAISVNHFHLAPGATGQPAPKSYAFRIETPGRVFVYTGDTGPSENLVRLAKGADVLVSEVVDMAAIEKAIAQGPPMPPGKVAGLLNHIRQDHLTPQDVGRVARDAGVKAVVLTHLSPGLDTETDLSGYTRGIAPDFAGPVIVAHDLERF